MSALERVLAAAAPEQERDDLRVQRGAAVGDAAHGVGERVHVGHAVLEQVARPLRGLRQQVQRVGLLDVLGEHEHGGGGLLGPDPVRGAEALVGVRGRHPHVDDRDVGLVGPDLAHQVLAVARLGDHVEAGLLEQTDEALAQEDRVVGDDDAKGCAHARQPIRPYGRSSWTLSPDSSALGTNPRAPERVTSGPKSEPSRLETRITVGALAAPGEPRGDVEAVDVGELDVEQHDLGVQPAGLGQRLGAVSGFADHVETLGFEQYARAGAERRMVVDDEDPWTHGG